MGFTSTDHPHSGPFRPQRERGRIRKWRKNRTNQEYNSNMNLLGIFDSVESCMFL